MQKEVCLITGGAGFIGSHLSRKLLAENKKVICVDNFTLGRKENIRDCIAFDDFKLIEVDVSDVEAFDVVLRDEKVNRIYHLAANSDIQKSAKEPGIDFKNTFSTTYSVLEGMRRNNIRKLFFASTSAIYGDKTGISISEDEGGLAPISYYGGAKMASEAFISSYSYMNEIDALIFRFPNVIGPGLTHGVILDFIRKLKKNPRELEILGNGTQCKPYLYVKDLVDAIYVFSMRDNNGVAIYNVGVEDATTVKEIADLICERMGLSDVQYKYTGGNVGWKGDVPSFQYDLTRIYEAGWRPEHNSNESVRDTLKNVDIEVL